MKRYLIVLMVILALTPVLLAGCAQEAELENRIASLETKLTAAESTIKVLQSRIEHLEKGALTEADILGALEGRSFFAWLSSSGYDTWGPYNTRIKFEYFYDADYGK